MREKAIQGYSRSSVVVPIDEVRIYDFLLALDSNFNRSWDSMITLCLKKVPTFKLSVTLSNLNRFSKFLHCWKAYEITLPASP